MRHNQALHHQSSYRQREEEDRRIPWRVCRWWTPARLLVFSMLYNGVTLQISPDQSGIIPSSPVLCCSAAAILTPKDRLTSFGTPSLYKLTSLSCWCAPPSRSLSISLTRSFPLLSNLLDIYIYVCIYSPPHLNLKPANWINVKGSTLHINYAEQSDIFYIISTWFIINFATLHFRLFVEKQYWSSKGRDEVLYIALSP